MTRPRLDDRDPLEPREWQPTSHLWARKQAIEATAAAVLAARENRKKPVEKESTE